VGNEYFEREVRPLLIPVGLDPAHPFPQVANKSLNFIVRLGGKDAFGRENEIAIVKVPRVLPRLIRMPPKVAGKKALFVSLSSVIRAHLEQLFPGREVGQFFAIPPHPPLRSGRGRRRRAQPAQPRCVGAAAPAYGQATCAGSFVGLLRLPAASCCSSSTCRAGAVPRALPVNLVRLQQLIDLWTRRTFVSAVQAVVSGGAGRAVFLRADAQRRLLIHQPFESFDGVLASCAKRCTTRTCWRSSRPSTAQAPSST
jgi:polyphosphate kinase